LVRSSMTHSMSTEPALQAVRSVAGGSVNATVRLRMRLR
jgi:hypothetical protein